MTFLGIPLRTNGPNISYSWFDALRAAGLRLETFFGGSSIVTETQFTIANNQGIPANITGLILDPATATVYYLHYFIRRITTDSGAMVRHQAGILMATYDSENEEWVLTDLGSGPDDAGVEFEMFGNQVIYTSDNQTGTASVSAMRYKAITMGLFT